MRDADAKLALRSGGIEAAGFRQTCAQCLQRLFDGRIHFLGDGRRRQTLAGSDEEIVLAHLSQTGQGVAGRRLAERQAISGTTDGAELVNGLKDRQQVEVKAAQIEQGAPLDFDVALLILVGMASVGKHAGGSHMGPSTWLPLRHVEAQ